MAITRKARVPMTEQIRLINECRQSGMTDAEYAKLILYNFASLLHACAEKERKYHEQKSKSSVIKAFDIHSRQRFKATIRPFAISQTTK